MQKKIIVHLQKKNNFKDYIKKMSFPLKYLKFFFSYLIKYCFKNLFVYW